VHCAVQSSAQSLPVSIYRTLCHSEHETAPADVSYEADPLLDLPHRRKRVRRRGVRLAAENLDVEARAQSALLVLAGTR
jgi:hypothetical protein